MANNRAGCVGVRTLLIDTLVREIERLSEVTVHGRVTGIVGFLVEVAGLEGFLSIGDHCHLLARGGQAVPAEVVGARDGKALVMPFAGLQGVGLGCRVEARGHGGGEGGGGSGGPSLYPHAGWLGRVVNAFGEPLDGKGPLPLGPVPYDVHGTPPPAHRRQRVGRKIDVGVRAINSFLTCCRGQRMGIFAGSGVGKSSLLSMIARNTELPVNVIGLVGERGREAREFIEDDLGLEGLARSVVVVATSDEPPLVRRRAAFTLMTIAEYFRDQGEDVLCMMDSVTRFAMAQREIGLSVGEPPATKGYTPSVFAELPRLLERAGPGMDGQGSITGLFAVLVEGDDHNEPIADAVRGILDGHIVLDREIAERGRFPAINVLKSVSRSMPGCNSREETALLAGARRMITTYENMAELIRLGAYRAGSDAQVDEAIRLYPALEAFLGQGRSERAAMAEAYADLARILGHAAAGPSMAATEPSSAKIDAAGEAVPRARRAA